MEHRVEENKYSPKLHESPVQLSQKQKAVRHNFRPIDPPVIAISNAPSVSEQICMKFRDSVIYADENQEKSFNNTTSYEPSGSQQNPSGSYVSLQQEMGGVIKEMEMFNPDVDRNPSGSYVTI